MQLSFLGTGQTKPEIKLFPLLLEIADWECHMAHVIVAIQSEIPVSDFEMEHVLRRIVDIQSEGLVPIRIDVLFDDLCLVGVAAIGVLHGAIGVRGAASEERHSVCARQVTPLNHANTNMAMHLLSLKHG